MNEPYILQSPTIFEMSGGSLLGGGEAWEVAILGTDRRSSLVTNAVLAAGGGSAQTIEILVYIGQERIDELVVKATQKTNYRSGGR